MTLSSAAIFAVAPLLHIAVYSLFGCTIGEGIWLSIYAVSVKFWLMTVGFSALCGVVVYGMQRTTFAFVSYILLTFGIIGSLITTALKTFAPGLIRFLLTGITDGVMAGILKGNSLFIPIVEYAIYVLVAVVLSAVVFNKKEMEF